LAHNQEIVSSILAPATIFGMPMKLDWELVRLILLELESSADATTILQPTEIAGYDRPLVSYHLRLLTEAGLVHGECSQSIGEPLCCYATSLTWGGHQLLETMRSKPMWNRIKTVARERGLTLSFEVIKAVAAKVVAGIVG
jgi:hypothetical protein